MRYLQILVLLLVSLAIHAQTTQEIDSIFREWQNPDSPGYAMAIIHKGKVVNKRAMGMANMEHRVPISLDTKFQLAGMSKHFTAFALLLLVEKGQLSLEDDLRKHLPELPAFDEIIRVKHLFSQSTGLNDYWTVKSLAGWREEDLFTHDDALRLIFSQQKAAFSPGSESHFSNTEHTLMAEVIERVSGQSFAAFCREQLFSPLGMDNTVFKDSEEMPIPGTALAYSNPPNGIAPIISGYANAGPTNLYTSINDLIKWEMNLQSSKPIVGSAALFNTLNTPAYLDDGSTVNPTLGTLTMGQQYDHMERGLRAIWETGTLGGYTSSIFKFTDQDFTVIVLNNNGIVYNGYLGMQSAYLFLNELFSEPASTDFTRLKTAKLSTEALESFEGRYWNKLSSYSREIRVERDSLWYYRGPGNMTALLPVSKNTFRMMYEGDEKITISFDGSGPGRTMTFQLDDSAPIISTIYQPKEYDTQELEQFTGTFYNPQLNTLYELRVLDGQLKAIHLKNGTITFQPVSQDLFYGDAPYLSGLSFNRNAEGRITGFTINTDGIRNLGFSKVR